MLRKKAKIGAAVAAWSLFFAVAVTDYAEAERTVKTVVVARHSIRAPVGGKELNELTPHKWPKSSVPAGWLAPRGALAETLMGQYFRTMLTEEGLFCAVTTGILPPFLPLWAWSPIGCNKVWHL